jgi:hypothetical protein
VGDFFPYFLSPNPLTRRVQSLSRRKAFLEDPISPKTLLDFSFGGQPPAVGGLAFRLPPELEAGEPPEARGLARDEVRLMVSYLSDNRVVHTEFRDLPTTRREMVISTPAHPKRALAPPDGPPWPPSTHLPADLWIVEVPA